MYSSEYFTLVLKAQTNVDKLNIITIIFPLGVSNIASCIGFFYILYVTTVTITCINFICSRSTIKILKNIALVPLCIVFANSICSILVPKRDGATPVQVSWYQI